MRERGLKPTIMIKLKSNLTVAPHAGAWIETFYFEYIIFYLSSLPMRERGLKHSPSRLVDDIDGSLPMRERGLKLPKT